MNPLVRYTPRIRLKTRRSTTDEKVEVYPTFEVSNLMMVRLKLGLTSSLFILIFFSSSNAKAVLDCPANSFLHSSELTAAGIKNYVEANSDKIKDPGDLICCLPREFRQNYVIVHTSISGQSSDVHGPRVLLFSPVRKQGQAGKPIEFLPDALSSVFSVNGGAANLTNNSNVEFMINNKTGREAEYYDVDYANGHPEMSGKNPGSCMLCHGNSGKAGPAGPKTIFDPNLQWIRLIKGFTPCSAQEKALTTEIEKATRDSIMKNPRYRCLEPHPDGVSPFQANGVRPSFMLADLNNEVSSINDRRVAKLMRSTPDFDRYKYSIVGAALCTHLPNYKMTDWFPPEILAAHSSATGLLSSVAQSSDLGETVRTKLKQMHEDDLRIASEQEKAVKDLQAGKTPNFSMSENATACMGGNVTKQIDGVVNSIKRTFTGPQLLDRYKADVALRTDRLAAGTSPEMRFLFEGRGIDISDWSTDPTPGLYRSDHQFVVGELLETEPSGSSLKKMEDQLRRAGLLAAPRQVSNGVSFQEKEKFKQQICDQLSDLSRKAFSESSGEKVQIKQNRVIP